jgi:hypothetical protein
MPLIFPPTFFGALAMADPTEDFADRLAADPFNATLIWNDYATACRAADRADLAAIADKWIAGDDRVRGELLAAGIGKWAAAGKIGARLLLIGGPIMRETVRDALTEPLVAFAAQTDELRARLGAATQAATQGVLKGGKVGVS